MSIDFNKDYFAQFDGNNGNKMIYVIQQLLINLKIADKTACLLPTELSPDDPPFGGLLNQKIPTNMTLLSNYITGLNPRAFLSRHSIVLRRRPT